MAGQTSSNPSGFDENGSAVDHTRFKRSVGLDPVPVCHPGIIAPLPCSKTLVSHSHANDTRVPLPWKMQMPAPVNPKPSPKDLPLPVYPTLVSVCLHKSFQCHCRNHT
ncbi:hypothetical protein V6N13_058326 [Hibiscus sabdariffa]|uniref:Uncharacterized protein n=1 Tax=Hibiscus sabdariffa TaxID=183260 RepID=A0ABR2GGH3_9ROSI